MSGLILRPYQEQVIDDTRQALRQYHSVLMQGPTGMGKTAITVFMMGRAAAQGKRAYFLVHQNELLSQTSKALWRQQLEHGMIASGKVRIDINQRFSLADAAKAQVELSGRRTTGSTIFLP